MKLSFEEEKRLCAALLRASGMDETDAGILSASVAHSDFTGIYSHGLSRFSNYLKRFNNGAMKPDAPVEIVSDRDNAVVFDCHNGCGVVDVVHAYEFLRERAADYGVVMGTARRSSNIGCGSYYAQLAARDGLIAIIGCNTVRCVAPFGGTDSLLGTNPIIVAVPALEERPIILDISTTVTAMGKIQAAAREGRPIPEGWALDADGLPTTDASEAKTVLPIAGPKGYGLAVMVEALSALLSGAGFGAGVGFPNKGEQENTGFFIILVDPARFLPAEEFKRRVDEYIRSMKSSRRRAGVEEILMPGELEMRRFDETMKTGHEVTPALERELADWCSRLGISKPGQSLEQTVSAL